METVTTLNDQTIDHLEQLAQMNVDSAAGFREAADAVSDKALAADFRVWAVDRTRQAEELSKFVKLNNETAPDEPSWRATLHQTWLKVRAALNSGNAYAVLAEAERGEDYIKACYEETLKDTAGSAVNDVLQQQYADVKSVHDRVRDMRDARKEG